MAGKIETKLAEMGIELPRPMPPIANYVPYVVTGNLVAVSGQVPAVDGKVAVTGKVSWGVSVEKAQEAARLCFINVLVHLRAACGGDLDRDARRHDAHPGLRHHPCAEVHPRPAIGQFTGREEGGRQARGLRHPLLNQVGEFRQLGMVRSQLIGGREHWHQGTRQVVRHAACERPQRRSVLLVRERLAPFGRPGRVYKLPGSPASFQFRADRVELTRVGGRDGPPDAVSAGDRRGRGRAVPTPAHGPDRTAGMRILLLAHRVPYAPNRGDRRRTYHLLRVLAFAPRHGDQLR